MEKTKNIFILTNFIFIVSIGFLGYSYWAKLYFESPEEITKNCSNEIDIIIDTEGEEIMWAAINIWFEENNVQIKWFIPNKEFNVPIEHTIQDGTIKWWLLLMNTNNKKGRKWFKWKIKYWTLYLQNIQNIKTTELKFSFVGPTYTEDRVDIYSIKDGSDIITSVGNKKFTFIQWKCKKTNIENNPNNMLNNFDHQKALEENMKLLNEVAYKTNKSLQEQILYKIIYGIITLLVILMTILLFKKKWMKQKIKNKKKNKR